MSSSRRSASGPVVWCEEGPCTAWTRASDRASRSPWWSSRIERIRFQPVSRSWPPVSIRPSVHSSIVSPGSRVSRVVG